MDEYTRRKFGVIVGSGALVGLAGCSRNSGSVEGGGEQLATPKVEAPPETWAKIDSGKVETRVENVGTAKGKILTFAHVPSREQVKRKTKGEFDRAVGLGFAGRFDLEGFLLSNLPRVTMQKDIKKEFVSQLSNRGISGVSEVEAPVRDLNPPDVDNPHVAGYQGRFSTGDFEMNVDVGKGETRTFTFENRDLRIVALVAIWKNNGSLYVAGGAWPGEPYLQKTEWVSITGDGAGDGADAKVRVTLPMMRSKIKSDVVNLVESTR